MADMLQDSYGRVINYLRLAVTDLCNLRCTYCMPKEGLDWLPRKELMTYDEMLRICSLFAGMGIEKIRITGGEPFVRKDLFSFLRKLSMIPGLKELTVTTNGVLTAPLVPELKQIGIKSVNLSLDTLDSDRFVRISHRDELHKVLKTLDALLLNGIDIKINTVVMEDFNISDIIPLVRLTKTLPISVRFIEQMPFNGGNKQASLTWNYKHILQHIQQEFPSIIKIPDSPHSTSFNYHIPGHEGKVGIIAAYSRLFCGSCNRIRLTPLGVLKTCLYDNGKMNVKDGLRSGLSDEDIKKLISDAVLKKAKDGWEAERKRDNPDKVHESMATIGG
ncbi:MAG: GTP 3',8-cyclase MoaA [Chitinophagaceae bacterium]